MLQSPITHPIITLSLFPSLTLLWGRESVLDDVNEEALCYCQTNCSFLPGKETFILKPGVGEKMKETASANL